MIVSMLSNRNMAGVQFSHKTTEKYYCFFRKFKCKAIVGFRPHGTGKYWLESNKLEGMLPQK